MYERVCYQKLDEEVLVWLGLPLSEIVISFAVGIVAAFLGMFFFSTGILGMVLGLASGAAMLALFRAVRTGGPGSVFTRAYALGVVELMPSRLRPRHLLPLSGGASARRFRMSPVIGEDLKAGVRDARKYFGR